MNWILTKFGDDLIPTTKIDRIFIDFDEDRRKYEFTIRIKVGGICIPYWFYESKELAQYDLLKLNEQLNGFEDEETL